MNKLAEEASLFDAVEALEEVQATPRRWNQHDAYQPSGMEWLEEIPSHWKAQKLKFIADVRTSNVDKKSLEDEAPVLLCNYVDVYKNDYITDAIDFMKATATDDQIARFTLKCGDVLITKDSEEWDDIAVPALVNEEMKNVVCGYHLALVRPREGVMHGDFLARAFESHAIRDQFRVRANGITRFGLSRDAVTSAVFPVPPLPEQRAIAAFLRRETAKIDALVEKKRRLIDLLKEKRAALISHAVTKGLNANAPMKPSGVEWLGNVPAHWELLPLKFVVEVQTGLTLGKKYEASTHLVQRPYPRVANVQDGYLDLNEITSVQVEAANVARYELRQGDMLMTEGGDFDKLGRGYVWEGQIEGCLHQNHIFAIRSNGRLRPTLLAFLTSSWHGKTYFTSTSSQTTNLASTNATKVKEFPILLPPLHEQQEILKHLDRVSQSHEALIRSCEHLHEYRSALISAAVTGKIDVRDEVADRGRQ